MKVLVTGGAGFIGSNITKMLCDQGNNVIIVDDLSFGYQKFVDKRAKFYKGSIADASLMDSALEGVDVVMHLAASSIISLSYTDPLGYYRNNLINGLILLEMMRKKRITKIIYSSTAAVYGEPFKVPVKEFSKKNPISSYGASKLAFEEALKCYYYSYGIESVSLRYYNVYGPNDEQRPRTRAIPMWIESVLKDKPIEWYWQGRQTRDFINVTDVCNAHLSVLSLTGNYIFNIGSGQGVIMKDLLKLLGKIAGKDLKTIDMGERKGDPMKLIADITLIKKIVGWQPQVKLNTGLRETFVWYKKQKI
jgi:UDP-glucose 4-epimerase